MRKQHENGTDNSELQVQIWHELGTSGKWRIVFIQKTCFRAPKQITCGQTNSPNECQIKELKLERNSLAQAQLTNWRDGSAPLATATKTSKKKQTKRKKYCATKTNADKSKTALFTTE
jgi:hypothetical protein